MSVTHTLVVGTAGHIDHGKSSLVRALTGTDPDRLPEEKSRGMTIDLGFAHLRIDDCDVYFVDVPGHERFIRNMVAGAAGIDLALLTVAADDGVMPQTREHVELLALLGVSRCLLVLTKIDRVDPQRIVAVQAEALALLASFQRTPAACVHSSATRGDGLDELRTILAQEARKLRPALSAFRWFRMPIDRAFSVVGRGTVVTGTVAHGTVQRNDELELWPAGLLVRVRELQSHNDELSGAAGRMRLAMNLANVPLEQVQRGCELATRGYLRPTRILGVRLSRLRSLGRGGARRRMRLHIATSEVLAELRLPMHDTGPGETLCDARATLHTARPIVATCGQRFVVRDESGSVTLGGGCVELTYVSQGAATSAAAEPGVDAGSLPATHEKLLAVLRADPWNDRTPAQLSAASGLADAAEAVAAIADLAAAGKSRVLRAGPAELCLDSRTYAEASTAFVQRLQRHLTANPRLPGIPRSQMGAWMPRVCPQRFHAAWVEALLADGRLQWVQDCLAPAGAAAPLSAADESLYRQLVEALRNAALQPPALSALPFATPRNRRRIEELAELGSARGELRKLAQGVWVHAEAWADAVTRVREAIRLRGAQTVASLRDALGSTRKTVVPLLEALDAAGITRRVKDLRDLGPAEQCSP